MRGRAFLFAALAIGLVANLAGSAEAATPNLGPVSATNIQGVSALLIGTVDPQGLSTTYYFEYGTQPTFSDAARTGPTTAGSGPGEETARAAIGGLAPSTTYYYRLIASNSSGTSVGSGVSAASFETTQGFGFLPGGEGFTASVVSDGGEAATVGGSHPYQLSFKVGLNRGGNFEGQSGTTFPDGDLRHLRVEMPTGMIVNPSALPTCTQAQFHTQRSSPFEQSRSGESCPDNSQIGTVLVNSSGGARTFGLFNLESSPGVAAQFGFAPFGSPTPIDVQLAPNPDGSYSLVLEAENISQALDLFELQVNLWGIPWAPSHDGERGNCLNEGEPIFPWAKCSVGEPSTFAPLAFLSLPPKCSGTLPFNAEISSWQQPSARFSTTVNHDESGAPATMRCEFLQFNPELVGHLDSTKASSPSGFVFRLNVDNDRLTDPSDTNATPPRAATITLPKGTTLNPSVGAGLGVCTPAQFAAETAFNGQGAGCPDDSKIGVLRVNTPIFDDQLSGAVFLAQPDDPATGTPGAENPFDRLLAVYMVAKSPQRGVMVKLSGKLVPNPLDGTIVASFDDLPQLPYTDLEINFRSGQRSFLVTPAECGYVQTRIEALPWGNAEPLNAGSYTLLKSGADGGVCPSGTPPFSPEVTSGAINSNVNSYTPYFIHISRKDTEQEISSFSLELPKGVTAKLAGIPPCPDSAIAAARGRSGFAEAAAPSCPEASQVGRTSTGYGVGSALTYTEGRVFLGGPYHGAPLSLVTINPATIGPFDLGTIVIRSAFEINPLTAQLQIDSSASDPIPHIIDGIVVHLRDLRIYIDRPEFSHNPSSCEPSRLTSTMTGSGADFATSADDSTATGGSYFQLLNCRVLGFRPRLGLRLEGGSRRGAFPRLRATFAARGPNDSNLKDIEVVIPRQEFLAQEHIGAICTRVEFAAQACPSGSAYGAAVAYTPMLDEPLHGKVYLRSSSHPLPDLVADLHSGTIHIVLEGRIGPGRKGGIKAFFDEVPDEPISRFVMTLYGGKRGLLVNSADICDKPPVANVKAVGQNNLGAVFTSKVRGQCRKHSNKGGSR